MARRTWILGAGAAGLLAACTSLLGDDFEVVSASGTSTAAATGVAGGGTGGAGASPTGTTTGGGTGGTGGSGGGAVQPGTVLWESAYGDVEPDTAAGIAYFSDGSILVGGYFEGSLDFGGGAQVSGGGEDAFAVRIGTTGDEVWANKWGGNNRERIVSVTADESDGVFLFGLFADTIDFGSPPELSSVDEGDLFAAKLSAQGDGIWAKRMGSQYIDTAYFVRSGPGGDPAFAGTFQDAIDIDATNVTGPSQIPSIFITRFAGLDGQVDWAKVARAGSYPENAWPRAIAIDPSGNVAFFGQAAVQGNPGVQLRYDGTDEYSPSDYSLLVLYRTDSVGGISWHERFETARAGDLNAASTGAVLACGTYTGAGDFATGFSLPTSEGEDVWAAQYSAGGTLAWARRYGGSGEDGGGNLPARQVRCLPLSDGSYVIVAISDGPFDVGGTEVPGSSESVVIARVAAAGDPIWTLRTSGPGQLVSVAVSPAEDELALLLNFDGTTGLVGSFDAVGGTDIYVARIAL